jgi:hypothetical protein
VLAVEVVSYPWSRAYSLTPQGNTLLGLAYGQQVRLSTAGWDTSPWQLGPWMAHP